MVTVSYGNGFLYEGDRVSGGSEGTWNEHEDGNTGTFPVDSENNLTLIISASASNKIYYVHNGTDLALSSTVYTKIRYRYKTSNATIKAKIVLEFSTWADGDSEATNLAAGKGQLILDDTSSTLWVAGVATITTGKTVANIRLYADGEKTDTTATVTYDFVQIFTGTFTLPNTNNIHIPLGILQDAITPIPSRSGTIQQALGSGDLTVTMDCDLDIDNDTHDWQRPQGTLTKDSYEGMNGQVFLDILHNLGVNDLWFWLDLESPPIQFKARLDEPSAFEFNGDGHILRLAFREYRHGTASSELYYQRWGLNL